MSVKIGVNDWSETEDTFLLVMVAKHKASKLTFQKISEALNEAGQNGELSPFRTATACMYRLANIRKIEKKKERLKNE